MSHTLESGAPCPECGGQARVVDSRASSYGVRRRRECVACGARFTTYERSDWPLVSAEQINRVLLQLREAGQALEELLSEVTARKTRRTAAAEPAPSTGIEVEPPLPFGPLPTAPSMSTTRTVTPIVGYVGEQPVYGAPHEEPVAGTTTSGAATLDATGGRP